MIIKKEHIREHADTETPVVIIPTFNQLTMLMNTMEKLSRFGLNKFLILDNQSTYPPLVEFFNLIETPVCILEENYGPHHFTSDGIYKQLPEFFFLTDPDLEYPDEIPDSLVEDMVALSEKRSWGKIGLALNKDCKHLFTDSVRLGVDKWESHAWRNVIDNMPNGDPVWEAFTDTTFCLYNKKHFKDFYYAPRIGGRYTLMHYGWQECRPGSKEENEYYDKTKTRWSMTTR